MPKNREGALLLPLAFAGLLSAGTTLVGAVVAATLLRRHLHPAPQEAGATQEA